LQLELSEHGKARESREDARLESEHARLERQDARLERQDARLDRIETYALKGASRMAPYEIVVFDVGKNQINGYLATPKEGGAAPAAVRPRV